MNFRESVELHIDENFDLQATNGSFADGLKNRQILLQTHPLNITIMGAVKKII